MPRASPGCKAGFLLCVVGLQGLLVDLSSGAVATGQSASGTVLDTRDALSDTNQVLLKEDDTDVSTHWAVAPTCKFI